MTGRDVTPNLLTHLAYPDAQVIHLHSLICAAHAFPLLRICKSQLWGPYANSVQVLIHEADIAAVAVIALTQDGHKGKAYPLTGPEALTRIEQLNMIGAAIGKKLRFQEIPADVFQKEMEKSMPLPVIKLLLDYWSETLTVPEVVLPTVEQLTGHKARTLAQWAKDHASDFSPLART